MALHDTPRVSINLYAQLSILNKGFANLPFRTQTAPARWPGPASDRPRPACPSPPSSKQSRAGRPRTGTRARGCARTGSSARPSARPPRTGLPPGKRRKGGRNVLKSFRIYGKFQARILTAFKLFAMRDAVFRYVLVK